MGAFLEHPITDKKIETYQHKKLRASTIEMQGKTFFTKDGENIWKMQFYMIDLIKRFFCLEFSMAMVEEKWLSFAPIILQ